MNDWIAGRLLDQRCERLVPRGQCAGEGRYPAVIPARQRLIVWLCGHCAAVPADELRSFVQGDTTITLATF